MFSVGVKVNVAQIHGLISGSGAEHAGIFAALGRNITRRLRSKPLTFGCAGEGAVLRFDDIVTNRVGLILFSKCRNGQADGYKRKQ